MQSGWARHPRLCHNNNVNLSPRVFPLASFPSSLFLFSLSLSPVSIEHGSCLHRRRQFAGHTKRVDNLKGKSSLLTQEGHRTANARAFSRSVGHNASRWTSTGPPQYRFSFARRSTALSHGPTIPRLTLVLTSQLSHFPVYVLCPLATLRLSSPRLFVPLLIPGRFWDLDVVCMRNDSQE